MAGRKNNKTNPLHVLLYLKTEGVVSKNSFFILMENVAYNPS
jgi:hypothetical protein